MCIMCLEFARDRMSAFEVRRSLPELIMTATTQEDRDHYEKISRMSDEELEEYAKQVAKENSPS